MTRVRYEILETQLVDGHALVKARLELPGWGSVEAYGIGSGSQAEACRAAAKDAAEACLALVEAINAGCCAVIPRVTSESAGDVQGESESGTGADEWDPEDVERMKQLKKRLGITDNEQLNKHVKEFSLGQLTSYLDITPDNIKAFCDYLESLLEEGEAA